MLVVFDWLKEYLGNDAPTLKEAEELLTFHSSEIDGIERVGEHDVLDVKILPNRASDCLSHRGIARELAALTGKPLAYDPLTETRVLSPQTDKISVTIEDEVLCPRFGMALITGIEVKPSPEWLQSRLRALGQRSINNVVDATNYVMLSLGQPLHAYDGDLFPLAEGIWRFGVRRAHKGETITTLTNDTYELDSRVQLIVDASIDAPAGIAGIKGGKYAEVTEKTTTILLEAANFEPSFTRKATQVLKLQTDASKRFENAVSPHIIPFALTEAVTLITQIAGGKCEGYIDTYPNPTVNAPVSVTHDHVQALLGLTLEKEKIEDIFTRLGFTFKKTDLGWTVTAPFERTDIILPEDVIEEIGRVYGYEHVKAILPEAAPLTEINARYYYSEEIRQILVKLGFSEVITSSFRNTDEIQLQNALASDKKYLRSSLRENITEVLDKNISLIDLLGLTDVRVFEIGTVFKRGKEGIEEHTALAIGVRTKATGFTPKDDVVLEQAMTTLKKMGTIDAKNSRRGGVVEINLTELISSLPAPTHYAQLKAMKETLYVPFSPYPFIARDIAVWVPETVTADEVFSFIEKDTGELLVRGTLFDEFKKETQISYAFRLVFQSCDRTLTDDEILPIMERITATLMAQNFIVR